jgi:hypothetical protein
MSKTTPYAVGMRYKTRCGLSVKIIHHMTNPESHYSVCGIMTDSEGRETLESWAADGVYDKTYKLGENPLDLLPAEVVDYEAMAKQLAIALREMTGEYIAVIRDYVEGASAYEGYERKAEHANRWLAEARKAGLIP